MKKTKTILIIISQFILAMVNAQQNKQATIKKQQFCSAEITRMDKSAEKFALGGFNGDSIIVYQLSTENDHLQILLDKETRIAASELKSVQVWVEKVKNSPDIYTKSRDFKKQANTMIASNIKGTHAMNGIGNGIASVATAAPDPITFAATSVILLPIIIPVAILTAKEKTYHINGEAKRLARMEKRLTKK